MDALLLCSPESRAAEIFQKKKYQHQVHMHSNECAIVSDQLLPDTLCANCENAALERPLLLPDRVAASKLVADP
jgi:predicted HAD superfamily phosphohydrolase YqeG